MKDNAEFNGFMNMANFVKAQGKIQSQKEKKNIKDSLVRYTVPEIGDFIVYNEIQKSKDKHLPRPYRGVGEVIQKAGINIIIRKICKNGHTCRVSISKIDFELGLYEYAVLEQLPEESPEFNELKLDNLSDTLHIIASQELVIK